jgi:diguanylate cyclase (GGDEF)-like protein/PAS domain S-box-containing protein
MPVAVKQRSTIGFMCAVIAAGACVCIYSALRLPVTHLDERFGLLALATICIGSRLSVKIPGVTSQITVSETFIFLTLLLFGSHAAILLAAAEGVCTSLRFSKKRLVNLFNMAVMACSYALTAGIAQFCFGSLVGITERTNSVTYLGAICLIAAIQYVANSGLVAAVAALRAHESLWHTWRQNYLYTSLTYFAGASAAGIIAKLISALGFYAFIATTPIIGVVYFTYWTYLKKVEATKGKLEQARVHVEELNLHIAEQEKIRCSLAESEERFRRAFDYAAVGMALVAPDGRWLQVNRALQKLIGYDETALLATDFQHVIDQADLDLVQSHLGQLLKGDVPACQLELRSHNLHGHTVWGATSISLLSDPQTGAGHLIFQIQDITARKRAEEQLIHSALHDHLTGLPNRALFIDHLKLAIERAKRRADDSFAVLFLDLDRFKVVNDSLGHAIGDCLLVGVARRLEAALRPGDTVARLGGDEFTVLLEDLNDPAEALEVVARLQQDLAKPFNFDGHEVFTTVSIGLAPSAARYERPEDMLRDADTAMYCAKAQGKARCAVFDQSMHSRVLETMQLENDLWRAVEREEFVVYYQPIVSLSGLRIEGFEALVRWQHPERGLLLPDKFISLAEETGVIGEIGRVVLRQACQQLRRWQDAYGDRVKDLTVSVNLSSKQFLQPDLVEQVVAELRAARVEPSRLRLEVTESLMVENVETANEVLRRLRAHGMQLSLDDFGTGYSSLSYLHHFPFNVLKVDRSFVAQIETNNENREIVRTILLLAQNLGMDVIAEGVELPEQLAALRQLKCEYAQGYLFARPLTAAATSELLDTTRTLSEHAHISYGPYSDLNLAASAALAVH